MFEKLNYNVKKIENGRLFLKPRVIFLLPSVSEQSPVISENAFISELNVYML